MDKIKYDVEGLKLISFFGKLTKVHPKDFFSDDFNNLIFVVPSDKIGLAVGKGGANVKKLKDLSKKNVRVIAFDEDAVAFVRNVIRPVKVSDAVLTDNIIVLTSEDTKSRGVLIGRNAANLRNIESIVKRFFPSIEEVKVE